MSATAWMAHCPSQPNALDVQGLRVREPRRHLQASPTGCIVVCISCSSFAIVGLLEPEPGAVTGGMGSQYDMGAPGRPVNA